MTLGLIGSGNMARAMARGWGEPVLCTDSGSGRAQALAAETGGEAVGSNTELAERADLVILCHKPRQLAEVAGEVAGKAGRVVSVLGGTPVADVASAYPGADVFRVLPNTPVEVNQGVLCFAAAEGADAAAEREVVELLRRLGNVVELPDELIDVASALMGVGPAYMALVVEAQVDAGVKHGLPAKLAGELVIETLAGTAALLAERDGDTLGVRRDVTSPGGSTARGLAELERAGLRAAFLNALDAVAGKRS